MVIAKVACKVFGFLFAGIMANNINLFIPILDFDGSDYKYWSIKMQTLLIGKDLLDVGDDGYLELVDWSTLLADEKKTRKECRSKNSFALSYLQAALDRSIFPRIASYKTTKDA